MNLFSIKRLTTLLFVFYFSSYIYAQKSSPLINQYSSISIKDIVSAAADTLNSLSKPEITDSIVTTPDFDFTHLKCISKSSDSSRFYSVYYKNEKPITIVEVDYDSSALNYCYQIMYLDDYILMRVNHLAKPNDVTSKDYSVFGFFLVDTVFSNVFFFGPMYFGDQEASNCYTLRTIYSLSKSLLPQKKLAFLYNSLVYYTKYDYSKKRVEEDIWQFLYHENIKNNVCEKYRNLEAISLYDILNLFQENIACPHNELGKAIPKKEFPGNTAPYMWDYREYYYK